MNPNNSPAANARLAEIRDRIDSGYKPRLPTEADDQRAVVSWLRRNGIWHFHPKNGGAKSMGGAMRDKAQGLVAGVPDLIITTPPPCGGYVGAAVEMKRITGGSISPRQ